MFVPLFPRDPRPLLPEINQAIYCVCEFKLFLSSWTFYRLFYFLFRGMTELFIGISVIFIFTL